MSQLQFETRLDDLPDFRADAVLGDSVFEVVLEPRDLRRLRSELMDAARVLATGKPRRSILILEEPQISDERLRRELRELHDLFRPEIVQNLTLVVRRESRPEEVLGRLLDEEREALESVVEHVRLHSPRLTRRPSEAFGDILKVLMIHWFRKAGPLALKDICAQTGFSYPTLAVALERLEPWLLRHSDRRVELRSFPRDEWLKLVANSTKARVTQGYTDRSGRPRPPEVLLARLHEIVRHELAVGGVLGARHYLPGLDLAGTPRLDLTLYLESSRPRREPASTIYQAIIRRLDAALVPAERGEPSHVVIHALHRQKSFFAKSPEGHFWADEVECLLDLHEARLESQALELLDHLTPKPKR